MTQSGKAKLIPPDGKWGWMIVLGVSLVNFSTRPIEPSFGLLFGDLLKDLSIATTGAGVIVSSYEAIINFSGLFVGPLIKSFSVRKVALFGSLLTGIGLMSTSPAASMAHILCTYSIINGLGIGFSSSATFVALNHYFKKKRGVAVGVTMTGTGLGLLVMPQAVRYLTEEYDFAGSILILGAFALNACVGSAILQPVKWHLKKQPMEEEQMAPTVDLKQPEAKIPNCPQITIENTITEYDEDEDENLMPLETKQSFVSLIGSQDGMEERTPVRRVSEFRPRYHHMLDRKYSLIDRGSKIQENGTNDAFRVFVSNSLNKSSTEPKFEKYFEENAATGGSNKNLNYFKRKISVINSSLSINNKQDFTSQVLEQSVRKRKSSTISNLSNLDFTGSCLHMHAIEQDHKDQKSPKDQTNNNKKLNEKKESMWKRFSNFMDLDLLRDPVYLNILFGISIFYVAELNFKMVVPFFLADLGHSKSETAFCLSMMAASDIVARVVLPPICDRLKITRRTMFMVAMIFCAISRSGLAEVGDWIQLETILIISGFFRGATLINMMLVISEYCDSKMDKLPAAFGIHMVAKGIFIVAFGPLIGLIRDLSNSYPLCIHAQSILMLMCIFAWSTEYVIFYMRKRHFKKPVPNTT